MVFEQRNHARANATFCCHHHLAHPAYLAYQAHCKSTVFYRTPAPIIVYYFPYITCLLYL